MGVRGLLTKSARRLSEEVSARSSKPLCIVYGNCQAEALRVTLNSDPGFRSRYRTVSLPAVHTITAKQVEEVKKAFRVASLVVTQTIQPEFHGLPIGTNDLVDPADDRVVTYPSMYFNGLFPFQVTARIPGDVLSTAAPITDYHDLRIIHAASHGWSAAETVRWIELEPQRDGFARSNYANALEALRSREASLTTQVTPAIAEAGATAFLTLNHPSNEVIGSVADQVLTHVGIVPSLRPQRPAELLGSIKAPIEADVMATLQFANPPSRPEWEVGGRAYSWGTIVQEHLAFYARRPDILSAAAKSSASKRVDAGLPA